MIQRIILSLLFFVCAISINAQLPEQGDYRTRVGTKEPERVQDLEKILFHGEPFEWVSDKLTAEDYQRYYFSFRRLADIAPYVVYELYNGKLWKQQSYNRYGLYGQLIDSISTDPAMKMVVVNTILNLARNFVDNLDSVNVVRNNRYWQKDKENKIDPNDTLSLPVAMTKYAHLYFTYAGNPKFYPAHLYDKVQARENYREAFKLLREMNIDPGDELEAFYVSEYYDVCEDLYLSDKEKYFQQFLEDYLEIIQTCDNLLKPFADVPDSIKNLNEVYVAYNTIVNNIQEDTVWNETTLPITMRFKESGAAKPDKLNEYYMKKFKDHRNDTEFLNKSINVLIENNCANTEAFFTYCEASYAIEPTFLNCFGCAMASQLYKMQDEMIKYFQEAYKHAENDYQRGFIAYNIGNALFVERPKDPQEKPYPINSPEYKAWNDNLLKAKSNFDNVLKYKDSFSSISAEDKKNIPAEAAYKIGEILYQTVNSHKSVELLAEAVEYYSFAINTYPKKYGQSKRLHILETMMNKLKEDKRKEKNDAEVRKRYEEYLRKKKQEEDFWNQ